MGWSCSSLASHRLDAISNFCVAQTGMQNVFNFRNEKRFFEVSRKEHSDGAITGTIRRENGTLCGNLRIEGNGTMSTGPKVLKDVPTLILTVDGHACLFRYPNPTDDSLFAFIHGEYINQYLPKGVNAHVATALGYIPYPNKAEIVNLDTGNVVASWTAAMFEVW